MSVSLTTSRLSQSESDETMTLPFFFQVIDDIRLSVSSIFKKKILLKQTRNFGLFCTIFTGDSFPILRNGTTPSRLSSDSSHVVRRGPSRVRRHLTPG